MKLYKIANTVYSFDRAIGALTKSDEQRELFDNEDLTHQRANHSFRKYLDAYLLSDHDPENEEEVEELQKMFGKYSPSNASKKVLNELRADSGHGNGELFGDHLFDHYISHIDHEKAGNYLQKQLPHIQFQSPNNSKSVKDIKPKIAHPQEEFHEMADIHHEDLSYDNDARTYQKQIKQSPDQFKRSLSSQLEMADPLAIKRHPYSSNRETLDQRPYRDPESGFTEDAIAHGVGQVDANKLHNHFKSKPRVEE